MSADATPLDEFVPGERLGGTAAKWRAFDQRRLERLEAALGVTAEELAEELAAADTADADRALGALTGLALYDDDGIDNLVALFTRAVGRADLAARTDTR